jgi:hypothetical protein
MIYHTDSALIRHLFGNLMPQIMKKYNFTDEEIVRLLEAKKIIDEYCQHNAWSVVYTN